jgi:acetyl-CoA decarbonylase/synthase complex subunit epsilon
VIKLAESRLKGNPTKLFNAADVQISRSAKVIEPKAVARMVKRAKHPVLVTGGHLLENPKLVEYAVMMYEKGIPIIATGASSKPLIERGVKPQSAVFTLHYVTQYMMDEEWNGFDGMGRYDVVLYLGIEPYYLSRMLSALKHFSKISTISLESFYQPHAKFSFPNLDEESHYRMLEELISEL